MLVVEGGEQVGEGLDEAAGQFDELMRRGRNTLLELDDGSKVFAEWYGPPPRCLVYGAVDTAEALCRAAKLLGWRTIVADARAKFATRERIPSARRADRRVAARTRSRRSRRTTRPPIVVLTHDDKFDEPALIGALATEAFYIGALGSRRNQERRRERLLEAGVAEERARADHRALRARHRRRHAGGDRALDPRGDPRRPRSARGRVPPQREEAHPRRGRVSGSVAWIAWTPVKSLSLSFLQEATLGPTGLAGDRTFFLVDAEGRLVNGKRVGALVRASSEVDEGRLRVHLPDGSELEGEVELGAAVETSFFGRRLVAGRVVEGPWAEALSELAGLPLTLVRADERGAALDRGSEAAASLVSTASLDALARAAGVDGSVDGRRFRMTFGVDGVEAHAEDGWLDRRVSIGEAVVVPRGNVGRCRVTTLDPSTGERDLQTLDVIADYRADVETTEPLPFGVWCEVVEPGACRCRRPRRGRVVADGDRHRRSPWHRRGDRAPAARGRFRRRAERRRRRGRRAHRKRAR